MAYYPVVSKDETTETQLLGISVPPQIALLWAERHWHTEQNSGTDHFSPFALPHHSAFAPT